MKKVNNNLNKFLNNESILFQEINEIDSIGSEVIKGIKIDNEILKNINTSPRTQKEKNDFMKAAEDNLSKMYERMIDTKTQEEIKEFYKQISKFNRYTISNINLAAFQGMLRNIEVSMLSSYKQFQEMGASVKKGQTALMIKKYEETYEMEVDENGRGKKDGRGNYIYKKDENGNKIKKGHTYIPVPVFDVSQTNAVELGLIKRLDYRNKDADISKELLDELVKDSAEKYELKIKFDDLFNEKLGGYYSPMTKEIVINTKNRTNGQMLSTLFHELGHYKLHTDLDYTEIHNNKGLIEGEAESVSFILSYKCGVENKSELYIAGWGNDIEGIKESQKKILKASQEINRELDIERLLEVDNQRMKEKMFEDCSECFVKLNSNEFKTNEDIINTIGEKNFNKFVDENNFFNIVEAKEYFFNNSSEENFSKKLVFDKLVELYNLNTNDNEEIENDYRKENIVIFIKNSVNEEFYNRLTKDNVINFEVAEYYLDRKITDKFYNFMDENKPKEYFIDVLKTNGLFLQKVPEELKNDYDIVMTAVSQNGSSLQFSSDEMKKNYDIVSKSIEKDGWNIEFANNKFYFEKDIIKKAVSNNGMILEKCLSESIKDVEIVYLATKNNEFAYNFASYTVKEKYGNTPEEFIDNYEKEIIQRNFTDNDSIKIKNDKKEVSTDTLIKLNEKNKELLKESSIEKQDSKLSTTNSNINSNTENNTKDKSEVKTSKNKQK